MGVQANLNTLVNGVAEEIEQEVDKKLKKFTKDLEVKMQEVDQKIISGVELKIEYKQKQMKLEGLKHKKFAELLKIAGQRIPIMMVGPAGTGKTHAGKQVADALGLEFYSMSVGAQTSKSDIKGYMDANGNPVITGFRKWADGGGVFVMDEIDAGNSNVTITINSALSNGYMDFPDGMVKLHEDCIFIATANTFGHGASREYVGRNQLDAATLDRFATIEWDLDEDLEKKLVSPYEHGENWLKVVKSVREYSEKNGLRALITPRATLYGARLLETGMKPVSVVEATLLSSIPERAFDDVRSKAKQTWIEAADATA